MSTYGNKESDVISGSTILELTEASRKNEESFPNKTLSENFCVFLLVLTLLKQV